MNHGKFRKFGGAKSEMTGKEEEEEGGSLMSKLENFSGMWTDLDTAPVVVDTKREIGRFQEEESRFPVNEKLDIGKGGEFSVRTLFQQSTFDEEVEEEKPISFQKERPFIQAETKKFFQPVRQVEQQQGYWKNAGMWHEPLFFASGDARFKEAVDFIQQTAKDEAYRDRNKWFEQREKLKQFYRNKMRRHALWVAESTQQPQKKRSLVDVADESSYHFYGQQDEIERQKKKKPHRTFFK